MHPNSLKCLLVAVAIGVSAPLLADADASLKQIYDAAESGHLDQAQQMMAQVLRDHPDSSKAHYVEAELDAKQGRYADARTELANAERLKPGLPDVNPNSVRALQAELNPNGPAPAHPLPAAHNSSFPWGFVILLLIVGGVVMLFFRSRRQVLVSGPAGYGQPGYGQSYGPGYGPGPGTGGGVGSGIVGGLASGLAVGAGVVAGEELAHHFLDGDRRPDNNYVPDNSSNYNDPNSNMGGTDFGVQDPGSWDDNSSGSDFGGGGGGGSDDWS